MVVEVRLFATLRESRLKKREMGLTKKSSLDDLLEDLKISEKELGILFVNGRNAASEYTLAPHDVVSIFPSLGGG